MLQHSTSALDMRIVGGSKDYIQLGRECRGWPVEMGQRKHYHRDLGYKLMKSKISPENMVNPRPIEVTSDQGIAVIMAILTGHNIRKKII